MPAYISLVFAIGAIGLFAWMVVWRPPRGTVTTAEASAPDPDQIIDPDDSYQIGLLAGLTEHSIPEAALLRFALKRFEEIHGRKATTREIGVVLGLI